MIKILIVEDEKPVANLMELNLSSCGYQCTCVNDGLAAADLLEANVYDLILLDIMLPGADGFELMDQIRPTRTPVIFITTRSSFTDRVQGLCTEANDFLVKPFEIAELLARVEAALYRAEKTAERYEIGDVVIEPRSMLVTRGGKTVQLTRKEYELLLLFVRNRNVALFRETIYERVWESEFTGDSRTVDLHVQRLRRKLGWQGKLVAIYKVGYRLEMPT